MSEKSIKEECPKDLEGIIERNVKTLVERRHREELKKPVEERLADAITAFTGNMAFIYIHIVIFTIWIFWNIGWMALKPFDPEFIGLQNITQIEAIFLTTFVLMTQRSLDVQADKRADLDLQISLLSEHEITRIIALVTAIAKKLDIKEADTPEMDELSKDVMPESIMDAMENHKEHI